VNNGPLDLRSHLRAPPEHPGKLRLFDLAARAGKQRVVARNDFGEMELDPSDFVQREILLRGGTSRRPLRCSAVLRPGDTSSISARMSASSALPLPRSSVSRAGGRVEPSPTICAALLRNRARTRPRARFDVVCAHSPTRTRDVIRDAQCGIWLYADGAPGRPMPSFASPCPMRKLATALEIGPVRAAKIDVEGPNCWCSRVHRLDRSLWPAMSCSNSSEPLIICIAARVIAFFVIRVTCSAT